MRLRVFTGQAGLEQIAGDWDRVLARMTWPHFWHKREWFAAYLNCLESNPADVAFVVLYDAKGATGILPLKQETRRFGPAKVRTLELPRHNHLHLRDILLSDDARAHVSLSMIVDELRRSRELKWDVLALWHALTDSCAMSAYRNAAPNLCQCAPRFACSHTPVAPWEEFSKNLSKNFRQNLRASKNRCDKLGGVTYETVRTFPALEKALVDFMDVEASGWKAKEGTAIKCDERLKSFYEDLMKKFAPLGQCHIHLMRHDAKPICGLFVLSTAERAYLPKVAYDEEYSKLSPMRSLLEYAFRQYGENPEMKEVNLTSDAEWFDAWKPIKSSVYNIYTFNKTAFGLAAFTAMRVADEVKKRRGKSTVAKPETTEPQATESKE